MPAIDLGDLVLETPAGEAVALRDLIDRPTVIDLVRYYGCAPCVAQLRTLAAEHDRIRASGGAVLGIGPAAAYQARLLAGDDIPFPLLLDPGRLVAQRLGLGRLSWARFLFDPRGWGRWVLAWFRRGRQGRITAGHRELPAIAIADVTGRVVWLHRGRFIGDYPRLAVILRALDSTLADR